MDLKNVLIVIILSVMPAGCASISYSAGVEREEYDPVIVGDATAENSALVKAVGGLYIFKVDRERIANFAKVAMGLGPDSVRVREGTHTMSCTYGRDLHIGAVNYKAGHEYLIDFASRKDGNRVKIYYWVKDLTDNEVVYGKEVTVEELMAEDAKEE